MKKERIKSIILTLLIINCVQLTAQIWFNPKLWPADYNFFNTLANLPVISYFVRLGNADGLQLSQDTTMPDKLVINGGGARVVLLSEDDNYRAALDAIRPVINKTYTDSAVTASRISAAQWQSMIKGKSIYVDFGFVIDSRNLAQLFDITSGDYNKFGKAKSLVIYPETVTNNVALCIKDSTNGEILRFDIVSNANELLKYIEGLTVARKHEHAFAFEMYLDKGAEEGGIKRKAVLDSDVLLTTGIEKSNKIIAKSIYKDDEDVSKIADDILKAFGYNPSQLRKSVSSDGVVTYVENSATVRISPNGLVEYNAVATERGIKISDGKAAPSTIINQVLNICKSIYTHGNINGTVSLRLRSMLDETPVTGYTVRIDRFFNGLPVVAAVDEGLHENAVYAEFENGYIKSFKAWLSNLSLSESTADTAPVLDAIDRFCEQLPPDSDTVTINNIYRCYYVDGYGEYAAKWCIGRD